MILRTFVRFSGGKPDETTGKKHHTKTYQRNESIRIPRTGSPVLRMGADLYQKSAAVKALFDRADEILGFSLSQTMFSGSDEELRQTKVTQPGPFSCTRLRWPSTGRRISTRNGSRALPGRIFCTGSCRSHELRRRSRLVPNVPWPCRKPAKPCLRRWRPYWDFRMKK